MNNKGADQPAHMCSLISAFFIRFSESSIPKHATSEITSFYLGSLAEQTGLSLTWSEIPEDRFCHDVAQMMHAGADCRIKSIKVAHQGEMTSGIDCYDKF